MNDIEQSPDSKQHSGSQELPKLYSKNVIYAFSIIFSTLFGSVLLMSNLKNIGDNKARWEVLIFALIFTFGSAITLTTIQAQAGLGIPLNILGAVILNEFFWNRSIGRETEFIKKSWYKPAIISIIICIPLAWIAVSSLNA